MAVNFNTAFYQNSKVERVINPKSTAVDAKTLDKKSPIEQPPRIEHNQLNEQVVKSDKAAIELLEQERQAQQDKQRTSYDSPNRNTKNALNAYQQVSDDDKRQTFASLVGVDIYV